jgi:zinc transport system substrate-binding protein
MLNSSRRPALAVTATLTLLLGACSAGSDSSPQASGAARTTVAAAFYPLEYAAAQVGGSHVTVVGLTKPGAEPHDLELTPRQVADLPKAGVIVYAKGFQPAVDAAVAQVGGSTALDVTPAAGLDLRDPENAAAADPHFWLDPSKYAAVVTAMGARFAEADPANAADYRTNATRFVAALTALDTEFRAGTATCQVKDLVTSHAAFGYLARRYGFAQVAIAGLSPEAEPSPAKLADVAALVKARGVTTIYAETLVDPKFASTIATSTGATIATLDPIEGITTASAGRDYLEVMRANLTTLRAGQRCA